MYILSHNKENDCRLKEKGRMSWQERNKKRSIINITKEIGANAHCTVDSCYLYEGLVINAA